MKTKKFSIFIIYIIIFLFAFSACVFGNESSENAKKDYIKWIDFDITCQALEDAKNIDIETYGTERHIDWIELLSYLGAKYGGDFSHYKKADIAAVKEKIDSGTQMRDASSNQKLYDYYIKAYGAVLRGMLGRYIEFREENGAVISEEKYGITAYSPIARNYYYSDFDDFGVSRSYGYKRRHLGHDMMGSVGTPIIAVEGGYVEACGWNQYGGWRIGIRSFDNQRYYYYAHLRKNHPFNDMYEGKIVNAGEVIGYLGMTGYSSKENVNNINTPHLHYGLQIIFDKSQKDGINQIWISMYELTKFLYKNRAPVVKCENGDFRSLKYSMMLDSPD